MRSPESPLSMQRLESASNFGMMYVQYTKMGHHVLFGTRTLERASIIHRGFFKESVLIVARTQARCLAHYASAGTRLLASIVNRRWRTSCIGEAPLDLRRVYNIDFDAAGVA